MFRVWHIGPNGRYKTTQIDIFWIGFAANVSSLLSVETPSSNREERQDSADIKRVQINFLRGEQTFARGNIVFYIWNIWAGTRDMYIDVSWCKISETSAHYFFWKTLII